MPGPMQLDNASVFVRAVAGGRALEMCLRLSISTPGIFMRTLDCSGYYNVRQLGVQPSVRLSIHLVLDRRRSGVTSDALKIEPWLLNKRLHRTSCFDGGARRRAQFLLASQRRGVAVVDPVNNY